MAPAFFIKLGLEARPQVFSDVNSDAEEARVLDWIRSHPELAELVQRALDLQGEEPAA